MQKPRNGPSIVKGKGIHYGTKIDDNKRPSQLDDNYEENVKSLQDERKESTLKKEAYMEEYGAVFVPIVENVHLYKGDKIILEMKGRACDHVGIFGEVWRTKAYGEEKTYEAKNQTERVETFVIPKKAERALKQ